MVSFDVCLLHACDTDRFAFPYAVRTIFVKYDLHWKHCIHSTDGAAFWIICHFILDI
jgi:hypothetical protein